MRAKLQLQLAAAEGARPEAAEQGVWRRLLLPIGVGLVSQRLASPRVREALDRLVVRVLARDDSLAAPRGKPWAAEERRPRAA